MFKRKRYYEKQVKAMSDCLDVYISGVKYDLICHKEMLSKSTTDDGRRYRSKLIEQEQTKLRVLTNLRNIYDKILAEES